MQITNNISIAIKQHLDNPCFFINGKSFSYRVLAQYISNIRAAIKEHNLNSTANFGLATHDDLETYASIFALWFEAKAYVPINPSTPLERNKYILNQVEINIILSSQPLPDYQHDFNILLTKIENNHPINIEPKPYKKSDLSYILFTSGSTGRPKGVPITFSNLEHLVNNIEHDKNHSIIPTDKCLQMFDLTFDFSIVTYLLPILNGACVYTIPKNQIKYFYIFKLINDHQLTYLVMVPSIIHYLKPYFNEISATSVRYCCFGAAPLNLNILKQWQACIPKSKLYNSYGPTEFTVTTSYYSFEDNIVHRAKNGVVSLGKPMRNITAIIIDENNNVLTNGEVGELCLAGKQLTQGYFNNQEKNEQSFFKKSINGEQKRFYKTGDLCIQDQDGYLLFVERKDFQVKVRGYRVELSEVEYHIRQKLPNHISNAIAIDITNELGNTELALAIESTPFDTTQILQYIEKKVPDYMIPTQIKFIKEFPHNINGKIDRNALRTLFKTNEP